MHFLATLTRLTHLNVAGNRLEEASFLTKVTTSLQVLHIGYNPLSAPDLSPIARLVNLHDICLSGLQLQVLPEYLSHLQSLHVLGLSNNHISLLSAPLKSLTNLRVLLLSGNQIGKLDVEPLNSLGRLSLSVCLCFSSVLC
jgi:Leucine-rich repeat (LRR) protein